VLTRRTQILLDQERHERLKRRSEETGMSIAALIREAIARLLDEDAERRRRAATSFLGAKPMELPDWPALEREVETAYERLDEASG
jgi:hypothetical protein